MANLFKGPKGSSHALVCLVLFGATCSYQPSVKAQCVARPDDPSFEQQRSRSVSKPWVLEGAGGIDIGMGFSEAGPNNAFVRNTQGWNAIRQRVVLQAGSRYTINAYVRTSSNVRDGYFGFRDSNQKPVAEIKYGPLLRYSPLKVSFVPTVTGNYFIFAGIWAVSGDSWAQFDNFRLDFPCNDT
jgi:hypothetical protein